MCRCRKISSKVTVLNREFKEFDEKAGSNTIPGDCAGCTGSRTKVDWLTYRSAWARGTRGGEERGPAQPPLTQAER